MFSLCAVLTAALLLFGVGAPIPQDDDRALLTAFNKSFSQTKDDEARLQLLTGFVRNNPGSSNVPFAVQTVVVTIATREKKPEVAIGMIDSVLPLMTNAEAIRDVRRHQLQVFSRMKNGAKVRELAESMIASGGLDYTNWLLMGRSAADCELFDLALTCFQQSLTLVSKERLLGDGPVDPYWTPERIDRSLRANRSYSLSGIGWSLAKLGKVEEGLAALTEAEAEKNRSYLGIQADKLMHYWAEVLIERGEYEAAMDKIARSAVLGEDKDAQDLLSRAYTARHGSLEGYDDYLWQVRLQLAVPIDEITATDYDGKVYRLSDFRGKVVLLNFWYPT